MASGNFSSDTGVNLNLYVTWSSSINIEENCSTVTMKVYLKHYSLYVGSRSDSYVTCNGNKYTYTSSAINQSSNSSTTSTLLSSKSFTVYHNSDGSKSITLNAGWRFGGTYSGQSIGWITCSDTVTLDTIPRQSSISSVTSSVSVDGSNAVTVNISRNSSLFTHTVKITFGSYSKSLTGVATTASYVIPMLWLNAIPNTTSGTATATITTYYGNTQIGSSVSKTFTITVPSSVVPSIGAFTATIVNNTVPDSWGIYIEGKSQCTLKIEGSTGAYSSTIKSYVIKQGSISLGTAASVTTPVLSSSGTITYTAIITDSRGRTASTTVSITVYSYASPSITDVLSQRCVQSGALNDDGNYIRAKGVFTFSSCNGKNSVICKVYYRKSGTSEWSTGISFTSGTAVIIAGDANIDSSYQVMYEVSDAFSTVRLIDIVSTAFTTMDFKKGGKGVGIGKVAEQDDLLDIAMQVKMPLKMQCGYVSITPSAPNTPTAAVVTFPVEFKSIPIVVISPATPTPGTQVTGVGVNNITNTSATIYLTRTNTTATAVNWVAIANN